MGSSSRPPLGPTLGGWITDNYTWNWCFFINVPIGDRRCVHGHDRSCTTRRRSARPATVDWPGSGCWRSGLGSLQYVLEEGQHDDWFEEPAITRLAIALGRLAARAWSSGSCRRATTHPVVDFRVLKNRRSRRASSCLSRWASGCTAALSSRCSRRTSSASRRPQTGLALLPGGLATAVQHRLLRASSAAPEAALDPAF